MAITQRKENNFKLENALSSGDFIKNETKPKVNYNTRTSMESKIASGNGFDINVKKSVDIPDNESAYEDSFCSDHSDEESEVSHISQRSSVNQTPPYCFTNLKSLPRKNILGFDKRYVSTSKICDSTCFKLEDKMKCLSLSEVRPSRSVQIRPTRKNMSFSNDEIMKIERDNEILLRKIMAQHKPQKVKVQPSQTKLSSSAINRRKFQRKIEEDNMILLQRLQQAKSCALNTNKIPGFRATRF